LFVFFIVLFFEYSEACKKFFLRSANDEHRKYKCMKDKKCIISRTTRTQCQYCRYMKCLAVGMKLSGRNSFIFQITTDDRNDFLNRRYSESKDRRYFQANSLCHLSKSIIRHSFRCHNMRSNKSHKFLFAYFFLFRLQQGCKGFFRRTIRERTPQRYKCPEKNNCEINLSTRHACRACRFQKCLAAGMSIEGSRIGRQSNLFKHKMVEMQRRGLIRSQLRHVIATNTQSRKKLHVIEDNFPPNISQQIFELEQAFIHYLKVGSTDERDLTFNWPFIYLLRNFRFVRLISTIYGYCACLN